MVWIWITLAVVAVVVLIGLLMLLRRRAGGMSGPKPRMQHYAFAHALLPQLVHSETDGVLGTLLSGKGHSPEGQKFLNAAWEDSGENAPDGIKVDPHGLTYTMTVLCNSPRATAYVITLPKPQRVPEAHFVVIVFDGVKLATGQQQTVRYFTLEHSVGGATVIGEWRKGKGDGELEYEEHGPGPVPEIKQFTRALDEIIRPTIPATP